MLPATTPLERDDISSAACEFHMVASKRDTAAVGEARGDYAIFADLAARLGVHHTYTEGRSVADWLRYLYDLSRDRAGIALPDFAAFWANRIEIFSKAIAGFGYDDCAGHPVWRLPTEWRGAPEAARYPLHLLSCQPRTRLHSQYDHGMVSQEAKVGGREPILLNRADAASRGITEGDVVRIWNDRGALLAGAVLSDAIRPGVAQIATGAWYDPADPALEASLDKHGNPNLVTRDVPASRLSQGCAAQSALVEIARYDEPLPDITAFQPPLS